MSKGEQNIHRPAHYEKNPSGVYFVTGRMFDQLSLMQTDERKHLFFDVLINLCHEYEFELIV